MIFYDHHGLLSCIRSFGWEESFNMHFRNIEHNAWLTSRRLQEMKKQQEIEVEKGIDEKIKECAGEFGEELHKATRERVITDSVKDNDY